MKRAPPRHGNDDLFLSAIDLHFSWSFVFIQQKAVTFNVCLGPVIRQRPVDPCSKLDTEQKKKNHLCHQMLHAWSQDSSENNLFLRQLCDYGLSKYTAWNNGIVFTLVSNPFNCRKNLQKLLMTPDGSKQRPGSDPDRWATGVYLHCILSLVHTGPKVKTHLFMLDLP